VAIALKTLRGGDRNVRLGVRKEEEEWFIGIRAI